MMSGDNPSSGCLRTQSSYDIIADMPIRLLAYMVGLLLLLAGCGGAAAVGETTPTPVATAAPTSVLSPVEFATLALSPSPIARPTNTPIPSATPEPTATSIVYVIEEGDTLLAVAAHYGISLDAIRLANPNLRAELLQIGQQVIIPPPSEENRTNGFLPSPTPLPLVITSTGWYTTPTAGLWLLGEVVNETGTAVENVRLGVTLYGQGGDVVAQRDNWVAADVVASGTAAPFGVLFGPLPETMATYETHLLSSEPVTRDGLWHPDLVVTKSDGGFEDAAYRVSGIVENHGDMEATEVVVVVTLYDGGGQVTGFLRETLPKPLSPAGQASFDLWLAPVGRGTERHTVAVSGRLPQEAG
jgi:LysM repeat protein